MYVPSDARFRMPRSINVISTNEHVVLSSAQSRSAW
jgi:hypothetical protein